MAKQSGDVGLGHKAMIQGFVPRLLLSPNASNSSVCAVDQLVSSQDLGRTALVAFVPCGELVNPDGLMPCPIGDDAAAHIATPEDAASNSKSLLQPSACTLPGLGSELENSTQLHSSPIFAPYVLALNQFDSLALNEVGESNLLHEVDDIVGISLKSSVQIGTPVTMASKPLDGKNAEVICSEVI
ncbi:hypothetical protein Nepgr_020356 [Nepenthes gracilis]|uniref:Uncharacterized protein n=1 Tax=Nepenthes gracilis TaxID=150966 RepID=A0AAD3SV79_NEPGR|nr:hypothetical protein Nepgr_020356 [Nepenthes gracilis]